MRISLALLILTLDSALAACSAVEESHDEASPGETLPVEPTGRLAGVRSWAYQLQSIDLDALAASDFELLVIDYADDEGRPFSAEQLSALQSSGKLVLSYLSIGEAETYRPYWDAAWLQGDSEACDAPLSASAPVWLDPANPDWCGNYPVRFWDEIWQAVIFDYLDAILAAGFDGIYLDKVDIFYYWLGEEDLGASTVYPNAAPEMAGFVEAIADYGRGRDPDFLVVPQNAPEIIEYLDNTQRAAYLSTIDAIGAEDTFFFPRGGRETGDNSPYNPQGYALDLLESYQAAGLPVFAIDYVTTPGKVERFYEEAAARGFVPYATTRELDRLTLTE